jgi:hypothetical protein
MENNEDMSDNGGSGSIRPRVDHTYQDFSFYLQHAGQVAKPKKACANFPAKLHHMLSDPLFSHIVAWMVRCLCQSPLFPFMIFHPYCIPH